MPAELRQVDHKAVIAWERFMRESEHATPSTIRRRLAALSDSNPLRVAMDRRVPANNSDIQAPFDLPLEWPHCNRLHADAGLALKRFNFPGNAMKKLLLAGFTLAAAMAPAFAADMPLKAPPPPPVPVFTWTGCYFGGSMGGIWRPTDTVTIGVVDGGSGAAVAAAAGSIPTSFSVGGSSWIAGGQAGCNYQAANWVFGIETDMSGTKLDAAETIATNVPGFFPLTSSVSQDMSWIGTTRGRLGWAWSNVLVYATGGAAYTHVSYGYTVNNIAGGGATAVAASDSATQLGWTAGGGLEVGFGAWSIRGEYLYYDLGSHTLTAACSSVIGGCTGIAPTLFSAHFRDNGSIARIGANYRL
jgi:outer membrane immunogenic protein